MLALALSSAARHYHFVSLFGFFPSPHPPPFLFLPFSLSVTDISLVFVCSQSLSFVLTIALLDACLLCFFFFFVSLFLSVFPRCTTYCMKKSILSFFFGCLKNFACFRKTQSQMQYPGHTTTRQKRGFRQRDISRIDLHEKVKLRTDGRPGVR